MTRHEFETLMRSSSTSIRKAAKKLFEDEDNAPPPLRSLQNPVPQCDEAPAIPGAIRGKNEGAERTLVRFTGYRVRPLDPDNFAGSVKDLLDGCRHAGLIPGDEAWQIRFETEQVRVGTFAEEKTLIEIITP